jgi:hypothetical protein
MTVGRRHCTRASFKKKKREHEFANVCIIYFVCRGSKFLKAWMQHLEDHADLRYANVTEVYGD